MPTPIHAIRDRSIASAIRADLKDGAIAEIPDLIAQLVARDNLPPDLDDAISAAVTAARAYVVAAKELAAAAGVLADALGVNA